MASHRAYLPLVSSPVAKKRYTSPTTATVRPSLGDLNVGWWGIRLSSNIPNMGGAACKSDGRYFIWMAKKDRKPKAGSSGEKWIVYIVRCADGSLYTGITKDVTRRCQQHNAGTASRYTRSRRPVKLICQEASSRPEFGIEAGGSDQGDDTA